MGGLDRGFAAAIGTWSFQLEAPKQNFRGRRLMALRDILQRRAILVAFGGEADIK
jgi:hypothetical protein